MAQGLPGHLIKKHGGDMKAAWAEHKARSGDVGSREIPLASQDLTRFQGTTGHKRRATYYCGNCGQSFGAKPGPTYRQAAEAHKADCHGDTHEHAEGAEDEDPPATTANPRKVA